MPGDRARDGDEARENTGDEGDGGAEHGGESVPDSVQVEWPVSEQDPCEAQGDGGEHLGCAALALVRTSCRSDAALRGPSKLD
jgi:hypothetical protein